MKWQFVALLALTGAIFVGQACSNSSMNTHEAGEGSELGSELLEKAVKDVAKEIPNEVLKKNGILENEGTTLAKSCSNILSKYGKKTVSYSGYVNEDKISAPVEMTCQQFKTDVLGTQKGVLTQSVKLKETCQFSSASLQIGKSNISLDCNNSVFTGGTAQSMSLYYGLTFVGNTADSAKAAKDLSVISNVAIRNCRFENYKSGGVLIANRFHPKNKSDQKFYNDILLPMHKNNTFDVPGTESDADELRKYSPSRILLENIHVRNTQNAGIYIQNSVTKVDINRAKTLYTRLGLYFDFGTREMLVRNSCFLYPGTPDPSSGLSEAAFKGREGIAVDASANNQIVNNLFYRTKAGAVSLYKNCWEHFDKAQFPRRQRADNNSIADNIIVGTGEAGEVGVSIAHRQWKKYFFTHADTSLSIMRCGDAFFAEKKSDNDKTIERVYADYARNNVIQGNTFFNVELPARIYDDKNKFVNNVIRGTKSTYVARVGHSQDATYRKRSVTAVQGVEVSNNWTYVKSMDENKLISYAAGAKSQTTATSNVHKNPGAAGGTPNPSPSPSPTANPTASPSPTPKSTVTPTPPVVAIDFSCVVSGNNSGCQKTVSCPSGKKVKEVRAACDLESGKVTEAQVSGVSWNQLKVVKASDTVADGMCAVSITDKTAALSGGLRAIHIYSAAAIKVSCREKDSNGGDCEIRGQLRCQ